MFHNSPRTHAHQLFYNNQKHWVLTFQQQKEEKLTLPIKGCTPGSDSKGGGIFLEE